MKNIFNFFKRKPVIKRKGYDYWVDGIKHKDRSTLVEDEQHLLKCKCGCQQFWIYQCPGTYSTDAICKYCRKSYCVHSG